ncbi:MAG: M20 family metallopeptidase [Acetobacteraceae bacterium]
MPGPEQQSSMLRDASARDALARTVREYVAAHADEMVGYLDEVVRIPSIWGDVKQLARLATVLGRPLERAGAGVAYTDSGTPNAPNVLARIGRQGGGSGAARNLLFCGHFDVYPPSHGWSFDPFAGRIHEGKLFGAGAADMKGGTVAMIMAGTVLAALGLPRSGQATLLAIPNHFEGGEGTRRALDDGLTAEAGIVCEPTDLDICAAQRGILYLTVRIKGVAAHSTAAHLGVNAIELIAPIIEAVKADAFTCPTHDAYGPQKIVNVAMVNGGLRHCLIPEDCTLTIDIRFAPSTTAEAVLAEARQILAGICARDHRLRMTCEPEETCIRNPRSPMPWFEHPIRDAVARAHHSIVGRRCNVACHPAWPDTPVLIERGVPSVTYGPGSKYCYWDEEYVPIDEYLHAIEVYATTGASWCDAHDAARA